MADINKEDVKLYASEVLADTDDGGGQMTSNEIIDGSVNNLFPDISRLDRTYGRVSLRKAFLAITTEDRATYHGAHVVLIEQASDPLVSTTIFTTKDWFDTRISVQDRIESYLVKGPQYPYKLYGDIYEGSRSLSFSCEVDQDIPEIGEVMVLVSGVNLAGGSITEFQQYVRVMDVSSSIQNFIHPDGAGYQKKIIQITIGDSLDYDFKGHGIIRTSVYTDLATYAYKSVAADASSYYGVSSLVEPGEVSDLQIRVADTKMSIVPSAQSQTAITDFGVGIVSSTIVSGATTDYEFTKFGTFAMQANGATYLGAGCEPGSFRFEVSAEVISTDDGKGNILDASFAIIGSIGYDTGIMVMSSTSPGASTAGTFFFVPAVAYPSPTETGNIPIDINNRGFVFVFFCLPKPLEFTLRVDFLASGKWYSLYDIGSGELKGTDSSIGSGTVNYQTGSVAVTLGAMPDIGSDVMLFWGGERKASDEADLKRFSGMSYEFCIEKDLSTSFMAGTLSIKWTQNSIDYEITDSKGALTGDGTGWCNYNTGELFIFLTVTPPNDTEIVYRYIKGLEVDKELDSIDADGNNPQAIILTNGSAIIPNTVQIEIDLDPDKASTNSLWQSGGGGSYTVTVEEEGGHRHEERNHPGYTQVVSWTTSECNIRQLLSNETATLYLFDDGGTGGTEEVQSITDATPAENDVYELSWGDSVITTEALGVTPTTADLVAALLLATGYSSLPFDITEDTDAITLAWKLPGSITIMASMIKTTGSGTPNTTETTPGVDIEIGNLIDAYGENWGTINYITGAVSITTLTELLAEVSVKSTSSSSSTHTIVEGEFGEGSALSARRDETISLSRVVHKTVTGANDVIRIKYFETFATGSEQINDTFTRVYSILTNMAYSVVAGSLVVVIGTDTLIDDGEGHLYKDIDAATGIGVLVANVDYVNKLVTIVDDSFSNTEALDIIIEAAVGQLAVINDTDTWEFRCPGAPIVPGSFTFTATTYPEGTTINGTATFDGGITGTGYTGGINYSTGVVWLMFGQWVMDDDIEDFNVPWVEDPLTYDDGGGHTYYWEPFAVNPDTIVMNCVVQSYLPLDAELLGLNPVRLPLDGKVPIFRDGNVILIHHTEYEVVPSPVANQVVVLPRNPVNLIELYDDDNVYVSEVGNYSVDIAAGTLTFEDPLDLSGYSAPFRAVHRVEDMVIASDVQITGHMSLSQPLTHDYPADDTIVSSVLPIGDMQSRVHNEFTDSSWDDIWSDTQQFENTTAQFDLVNYPIIVINRDAVKERFACIFTSSSAIRLVGEHLGVIYQGGITSDVQPINPATGFPYFIMRHEGWGTGWNAGEVLRFNVDAANYPTWFIRTTQQGPATENSDHYQIQKRGDSS